MSKRLIGFTNTICVWMYILRFCVFQISHISWIVFPKILQLTEGYILTIWNILESVLRLQKILRKIPCVSDCVIIGEVSLRWSTNLTKITLRPFGIVSKNLESVAHILSKFHKILFFNQYAPGGAWGRLVVFSYVINTVKNHVRTQKDNIANIMFNYFYWVRSRWVKVRVFFNYHHLPHLIFTVVIYSWS